MSAGAFQGPLHSLDAIANGEISEINWPDALIARSGGRMG